MVTMTSGSRPRASVNGFGEFPGWVQPAISEEAHHRGVQRTARFGPSGLDADSAPRVVIKQDSGGQASPRVVDTQEQDHRGVSHGPTGEGNEVPAGGTSEVMPGPWCGTMMSAASSLVRSG